MGRADQDKRIKTSTLSKETQYKNLVFSMKWEPKIYSSQLPFRSTKESWLIQILCFKDNKKLKISQLIL